jgi:Pyruvate/2-oxoacid:ferredoxin oxidoreductase delta subunit
MRESTVYTELAEKLGVPDSERFVRILEASFTEREAIVCSELFEPATADELSEKLTIDLNEISTILDNLIDKGALTRGETQFAFHKTLLAYHHDSVADTAPHAGPHAIPQHIKDLWADFFRNEWSYEFMEHTEKMIEATGRSLPIWPAIGALERSPNIKPEDILPEENWKLKIEEAKRRIIAPCGCRVVWGTCDHPLMCCFATFDRPRGVYYLNRPGRLLKEVSLEEALATAREAEESGLVHWGDCYCCDDCCENLFGVTRDKRFELMTPNRFLAVVDEDKCTGCKVCIKKCKFDAIEMKKVSEDSKKQKAVISAEMCKGCGLCIIGCKKDALHYEIVRPPEYIKGRSTSVSDPDAKPRTVPVWGHYDLK